MADFFSLRGQKTGVLVVAVVTGGQGYTGFFYQGFGGRLAAHGTDGRGRRANEDHTGLGVGIGKVSVLGQKSVAWMHSLRKRTGQPASPLRLNGRGRHPG